MCFFLRMIQADVFTICLKILQIGLLDPRSPRQFFFKSKKVIFSNFLTILGKVLFVFFILSLSAKYFFCHVVFKARKNDKMF